MQMYRKIRKDLKARGLKREEQSVIINVIQKEYEPLMQNAEHVGRTLCPKKLPYMPVVMPLLEQFGFNFEKEGEDFFIFKV